MIAADRWQEDSFAIGFWQAIAARHRVDAQLAAEREAFVDELVARLRE